MQYQLHHGDTLFAISGSERPTLRRRAALALRPRSQRSGRLQRRQRPDGRADPRRRRHAADADYNGPGARKRRRAGVQDQPVGATSSRNNRCGGCHNVEGGQTPQFARNDDVNLAYQAANTVVNLDAAGSVAHGPEGRRRPQLLARERLRPAATCSPCGSRNWAGAAATAARRSSSRRRRSATRAASKSFPADSAALLFASTVYPGAHREVSARAATRRARRRQAAAVLRRRRQPVDRRRSNADRDRVRGGEDPRSISTSRRTRASCCACATSSTTAGASSCAADADAMQAAIKAFADAGPADAGRSESGHSQGADAVRRHGREPAATATRAT